MSADDCVFCKIVTGELPATKIYEDEAVLVFLDIGPISDGHTLLIPKQHFAKLHDCPPDLLGQVSSYLPRIAGAVSAAMDCDGYNLLCNNGRAAGQLVEHLHFHIIPRNSGDGLLNRWPAKSYDNGEMDVVADRIRQNLRNFSSRS